MGPRSASRRSAALALTALVLLVQVGTGCGDDNGDGDERTPESLESLLPPPAQVGPLRLERSLAWDNATDFIVQGTVLPQSTAPSSAIGQMDDSGFSAAAGQILTPEGGGEPVNVSVAAFDSADGAAEAQDYLHEQDLQQPCFAACAVNPEELAIQDVAGVTAVHQVPVAGDLPPGVGPFEAFAAEFTIGSDLFYVYARGDPGDVPAPAFERGVQTIYEHAQQQSG
jgi:hypothetical protein